MEIGINKSHRRSAKVRRKARGGFTLIEVLVGAAVVGTWIASIVSMWAFAYSLSATADQQSVGYTLGRRAMEEVKQTGFQDTPEGTTTAYYDGQGGSRSTAQTAAHAYSVSTAVFSDVLSGTGPASTALRTVTVTVTFISTGKTVYTCSTYLARAGI